MWYIEMNMECYKKIGEGKKNERVLGRANNQAFVVGWTCIGMETRSHNILRSIC